MNIEDYEKIYIEEVSLKDIIKVCFSGLPLIIFLTIIFSISSVFYSLSLPNLYTSQVTLIANDTNSMNAMPSGMGGLASLAGVSVAPSQNKSNEALAILESKKFLSSFIEKNNITPEILASNGWDSANNKIIYDSNIYDEKNKKWVRPANKLQSSNPSLLEAQEVFLKDNLSIIYDQQTGFVIISLEYFSPYLAKEWLELIVMFLNKELKNYEVDKAEKSILYLENLLTSTRNKELASIFNNLIGKETKTIMLASSREEYFFRTLDPAFLPEKKSKPSRAIICVIGAIAGFSLSLFLIFLLFINNKKFSFSLSPPFVKINNIR